MRECSFPPVFLEKVYGSATSSLRVRKLPFPTGNGKQKQMKARLAPSLQARSLHKPRAGRFEWGHDFSYRWVRTGEKSHFVTLSDLDGSVLASSGENAVLKTELPWEPGAREHRGQGASAWTVTAPGEGRSREVDVESRKARRQSEGPRSRGGMEGKVQGERELHLWWPEQSLSTEAVPALRELSLRPWVGHTLELPACCSQLQSPRTPKFQECAWPPQLHPSSRVSNSKQVWQAWKCPPFVPVSVLGYFPQATHTWETHTSWNISHPRGCHLGSLWRMRGYALLREWKAECNKQRPQILQRVKITTLRQLRKASDALSIQM